MEATLGGRSGRTVTGRRLQRDVVSGMTQLVMSEISIYLLMISVILIVKLVYLEDYDVFWWH